MAIQAQLYQDNYLGFQFFGSSQEYSMNKDHQKNNLYHNHHHQQQQQMLFHGFESLNQRNDTMVPNSFSQAIMFDHLEKTQRHEIDQYIKYQNERLRRMIQDQRKQQLVSLMRNVEPKIVGLLREKEEEISKGKKRTMELEELLRTLEDENVTWQKMAQESEAMVVTLNSSLEQAVREKGGKNDNVVEDEESCCEQKRQSVSLSSASSSSRVCESCGYRDSCMVLLPCRHFCSCKACETFLDSCPVCREPKKASIEALIF